jgi:hypothetical protein
MSAVSFRSVFMVASCAGAALGCYLVSLRVASERAALEAVETKIVLAQRDIRVLQTEIGTRGRLAQLERWNVKVMALSAPTADQFLKGGFELARFTTPQRHAPIEAPVVLASAPARSNEASVTPGEARRPAQPPTLMHEASLKTALPPRAEVSLAPRTERETSTGQSKAATKLIEKTPRKAGEDEPTQQAMPKAGKRMDRKAPPTSSSGAAKTAAKPNLGNAGKAKPATAVKASGGQSAARAPLTSRSEARAKVAIAIDKPARDSARKQ